MVMHFWEPHRLSESDAYAKGEPDLLKFFEHFFSAVREASETASVGSIFQGLKSTLQSLEPFIKDRDSLNLPKEITMELIDLMRKGEVLVCKCLRRGRLVYWNPHHYAKKLQKLQENILRLFRVYIPLSICHDSKELLLEVKDLRLEMRKLNKLAQEKVRGNVKRAGGFERCKVPKEPNFMVGLDGSYDELKRQLLEGGVSVLVVSAPEGFGKTALVKKLGHDSDIEGKFKSILFINISKSRDFIVMVQRMIQSHRNGLDVPNIETEGDAVDQLQQLLTEIGDSPILLILDDVPSQSESLLQRFVFEKIPDYKILVTSRFEFPSFGPTHQLSRLNNEDAKKLFLHSAIPQFGNPPLPNEELIEKMVELCKGSPLALTVLGKWLCGKHLSIWRSRLLEWSEDPSFSDSGSEILDYLGKISKD